MWASRHPTDHVVCISNSVAFTNTRGPAFTKSTLTTGDPVGQGLSPFGCGSVCVEQADDLFESPLVTGDTGRDGGRRFERLMPPREVVVHEVERDRRVQVLVFLEKALVRRVNRRMPIRIVRFCRST